MRPPKSFKFVNAARSSKNFPTPGLGYDGLMMMRLSQLNDVEMNDQADFEIQRNFFNVETYLQHL